MVWCYKANSKTNPPRLETKLRNYVYTYSNVSIAKVSIWQITTNVYSGNTALIMNGTLRKYKKLEKLEQTQLV